MKEKRSKGKSGKVKHDSKRSHGKCTKETGGDWRQQTVDYQTKVNGDKIEGEGKKQGCRWAGVDRKRQDASVWVVGRGQG